MKHHCPMCGEQWNEDVCAACGWHEGKQARYSTKAKPPKALDSIVDVVLAYRPKARSKPAIQRKRRATKIAKAK